MVPERRVVRYAPITYDAMGAAVAPTGAEIQRFYTANKAVYGPSETRRLSQIILPVEAAAADVAERAPSSCRPSRRRRSEEHTSELQSLRRISYAVFCMK